MKPSPPSPFELPFGSLLIYSPRGAGEVSVKSRNICYSIKGDKGGLIRKAAEKLARGIATGDGEGLSVFLNPKAVLVPVPRSSPLQKNSLWPSQRISEELLSLGLGDRIAPLLERTVPVSSSKRAAPGERPNVATHLGSIDCRGGDMLPKEILLVDDVVTRGATLVACAAILREAFPNATVRAFAMVRTMGRLVDVETIVDPCMGTLRFDGHEVDRVP